MKCVIRQLTNICDAVTATTLLAGVRPVRPMDVQVGSNTRKILKDCYSGTYVITEKSISHSYVFMFFIWSNIGVLHVTIFIGPAHNFSLDGASLTPGYPTTPCLIIITALPS